MKVNSLLKKLFLFSPVEKNQVFELEEQQKLNVKYDSRDNKDIKIPKISKNIEKNYSYIKERFNFPKNNDVVIRKFLIMGNISAFVIFYDGMVDTRAIDQDIIKALLELPYLKNDEKININDATEQFISHSQATKMNSFEDIIDDINFGSCGLFIDGLDIGISLDVRNWGHRSIDKPETEQSIYGPQEAFAEMLRNNSALVRKILKTEKLICEGIKVGNVSKTRGVLMYISNIANEGLVSEVKRRINSVTIDYCISIEEVAMLIEESSFMITSTILSTERPDRVARALEEGRVALILNGNPHALIFPTNAFELMHASSDAYLRTPYANMTRYIRIIAMLLSVLLPALYLAITLFHQEMIPTFLVYAISASRESVPFPSIVELLLMDISFEMIREAGIRMPNPLGSTLGIVGGLILGQAAVSAKIVSPIMIIVIALTGLGSFATPDYNLSWSCRILRLAFITLAGSWGFFGVAIGIFIYSVILGSKTSFGVPFLAPLIKKEKQGVGSSVLVSPIWKKENRPQYLKTNKKTQEPDISMKWRIKKK